MSWFAILLIHAYQKTIGLVLPRVCRFEPTCSTYAIQAIRTHGLMRGAVMAVWRVMRCNPLCRGGWDPVPERGGRHE